jgi:hypothetical protein
VNPLAAFTDWVRRIVREEIAADGERRSHDVTSRYVAILERWDGARPQGDSVGGQSLAETMFRPSASLPSLAHDGLFDVRQSPFKKLAHGLLDACGRALKIQLAFYNPAKRMKAASAVLESSDGEPGCGRREDIEALEIGGGHLVAGETGRIELRRLEHGVSWASGLVTQPEDAESSATPTVARGGAGGSDATGRGA